MTDHLCGKCGANLGNPYKDDNEEHYERGKLDGFRAGVEAAAKVCEESTGTTVAAGYAARIRRLLPTPSPSPEPGARCDECEGSGLVRREASNLPDECRECRGSGHAPSPSPASATGLCGCGHPLSQHVPDRCWHCECGKPSPASGECAPQAHDFLDGECRKCGFLLPSNKGWQNK